MEVSSQGLMMDRVAGVHYDVGVFTNLSPDHIGPGEHKTFEEYRSWKGQLFKRCDVGVVNIDDENTAACWKAIPASWSPMAAMKRPTTARPATSCCAPTIFWALLPRYRQGRDGRQGEYARRVQRVQRAGSAGRGQGAGSAGCRHPRWSGQVRGEGPCGAGAHQQKVHHPAGLCPQRGIHREPAYHLRAYKPHRLVVVFGCGGNRSKLRRYGMGEICAKMADFSILTEDNNRFEKVEDIIADIREGMNKGNPDAKFVEIPDRLDALHYAVDHAQEGDLIAVIGKGHETYRDREGVKTPFLERELLEEYAQQIGLE